MKKFIVLVFCFISVLTAQAQSEVFAGGEIFVEYAGNGTELCGDPVPYHITLKFSRDEQSAAFPQDPTKTVTIKNSALKNDPNEFTVELTDVTYDRSPVPIRCLTNVPVATESRWYRTDVPVLIPGNMTAQISYANLMNSAFGRNFQSAENLNIVTGQRFFVKTTISTRCNVLISTSKDADPLKMIIDNQRYGESTNWLTNDIVLEFCNDSTYAFDFEQFIDKSNSFYTIDTVLLRDSVYKTVRNFGPDTTIQPDVYSLDSASVFGAGSIFKRETIVRGDTTITGQPLRTGATIIREDRIVPVSSAQVTNTRTIKNLQVNRRDSIIYDTDLDPNVIDLDTMVVTQFLLRQDICDLDFIDNSEDTLRQVFTIRRIDRIGPNVILDTVLTRENILLKGELLEERFEVTFSSVFRDDSRAVAYVSPYGGTYPFPTSFDGAPQKVGNVYHFTPQLPPGVRDFTAAVGIRVDKIRRVPVFIDAGGGALAFDKTSEQGVSVAFRQMRFVIGSLCNGRLPDFNSQTPFSTNANGDVTAWEFNCASTELEFTMTEPMLASSLIGSGTPEDNNNNGRLEFRIFRGDDGLTLDDNPIAIDSITIPPGNINTLGEFTAFTVHLYEPIGPGTYTMFSKLGTDGNTLISSCAATLPEDSVTQFVVNNDYDYDYYTDIERFCYPADHPNNMFFDAIRGLDPDVAAKAIRFEFAFRGTNILAPEQFRDVFFDKDAYQYDLSNSFTIPTDFPVTTITDFKEGFWNVGVGLDFSYTYNDVFFQEVCFGEDTVNANFLLNPEVTFSDIDLCANEEWPVVRPTIDYTNSNVALQNLFWGGRLTTGETDPDIIAKGDFRKVGGQSNDNTINDSLDLGSFAFGLGNKFDVRAITEFDNGCLDTTIFFVERNEVLVDIGVDSLICPGEQYFLENILDDTYLVPEAMTYEWYFNNTLVPDADTSTFLIVEEGWYKCIVTKTTATGSCFGVDSVRIQIADELFEPEPVCVAIDYVDGIIEQEFYIPPMPGADFFEARGIDEKGNPLGDWERVALEFPISGAQVRVEVRAVNGEVDSMSVCRYGPVGLGEACDVIVKPVNIFTPNGDGVNDFLKFHLVEIYPGSKLQIYNRWGRLIYESDNYFNDWDGEDHKDGTYFYILDVNDPEGQQGLFKGNFTIVR